MANYLNDPTVIMVLVFLCGIVLANMLSKNLIRAIIQVKILRKGNMLVQIAHDLEDYFIPGSFDANVLQFTTRRRPDNKTPKRALSIDRDVLSKAIFKVFGLECVLVDDVKNSVFIRDNGSYRSVGGYNAEAMSEKMDTLAKKPPEDELGLMPPRQFQIFVLVLLVVLGVGLYILYQQIQTNDAHTKLTYDTLQLFLGKINATG